VVEDVLVERPQPYRLIIGNKMDLKKANLKRIESAFPQYKVVGISAIKRKNIDELYKEVFKLVK
jgi:50S ribosomal subunit-associated GTPase HflX